MALRPKTKVRRWYSYRGQ